ncbi:MAG: glycosyltransferase family 2 protein [Planctomycetes bacterium]|nr:glycosyltransferase family 2 protein [Planctomycetota bacterium]
MNPPPRIAVVIPALNEAPSIPLVLADLPADLVAVAVVCDNGSTDGTPEVARGAGAVVVHEPERGYGAACLRGLSHLAADPPDIVVFLDGDYSDHPEQLTELIDPIVSNRTDLVIGSRMNPGCEPGALLPQAAFGNRLAVFLIRWLFGHRYTDLGPFRAIRRKSLDRLGMVDTNFGWTVEMQIKAVQRGLRIAEVPVRYRKRVGRSKITGTVSGTIRAGYKILWTIARYRA